MICLYVGTLYKQVYLEINLWIYQKKKRKEEALEGALPREGVPPKEGAPVEKAAIGEGAQ